MIEVSDLTKFYGDKAAVDHLTFTVEPGRVTGFLGPNGAGKSTTMRLILGLDRPNAGLALVNGRRYRDLRDPLRTVGALLEAKTVHPGRTARNHLLFLAQTQGLPPRRVDEVLALVGLQPVADKRAGSFSLGMSQRLGVAVAMLGDPQVLLLDEPVNGLDPEGVLWIRNLMKSLADEGRTILVSSHLMNEMAVTADHLIVIGRGKLITEASTEDVIARSTDKSVRVDEDPLGALHGLDPGRLRRGVRRLHRADHLADRDALDRPAGRGPGRPGHRRPGRLHPGHRHRTGAARHLRPGRAGPGGRRLPARAPRRLNPAARSDRAAQRLTGTTVSPARPVRPVRRRR